MLAHEAHTQHAIRQLQRMNLSVVAGAAINTNITVTGITVGAEILTVLHNTAGVLAALDPAEVTVTAADTIQLGTTNTTGDQLAINWLPAPATLSA